MKKIKTIFDRDWEGNKGVIDAFIISPHTLEECLATEKVDGTNVRLSVRDSALIALEKRRNPNRKDRGLVDPWYVPAVTHDPSDKHIWEAAQNTDLELIPDGQWSGEAVGPKIQGNPLKLDKKFVVLFSCNKAPKLENVPLDFSDLEEYLQITKSKIGEGLIEGIVWHHPDGRMFKIKGKDFK